MNITYNFRNIVFIFVLLTSFYYNVVPLDSLQYQRLLRNNIDMAATSLTSRPTSTPTAKPTAVPSTSFPTITFRPTGYPTRQPSRQPTRQPSRRPTCRPSRQPTSQPSRRPTRQPTRQPSRQPTMQPTRKPIVKPSGQPTRKPTRQPSRRPSRQPTSQPSRQPTRQPSRRPSRQPTRQPSSRPTMQPTNQPSSEPSSQPSNKPTMQPTLRPTMQPSSQPSRQPSVIPTRQPSSQPSSKPSRQPSSQPTMQPSRQPTRQPSSVPTLRPTTSAPTSTPTVGPSKYPTTSKPTVTIGTSQPTRAPSSKPTVNVVDEYNIELYSIYKSIVLQTINSSDTLLYNTYSYKGITLEGRQEWPTFTYYDMQLPHKEHYFYNATLNFGLEILKSGHINARGYFCDNPEILQNLAHALYTGVSYSADCQGDLWRVYHCPNYGRVMCVDCIKSCSSTSCPGKGKHPDYTTTFNPNRDDCYSKKASFSILNLYVGSRYASQYNDCYIYLCIYYYCRTFYPEIYDKTIVSTGSDHVVVALNVSLTPGRFYCSAILGNISVSSERVIKQYGSLFVTNTSDFINIKNNSYFYNFKIKLRNLIPEQVYNLYCISEDYQNNITPWDKVKVIPFKTACCGNISFATINPKVIVNSSLININSSPSNDTFFIYYTALLSSAVTVNLTLTKSTSYKFPNITCSNINKKITHHPVTIPSSLTIYPSSSTYNGLGILSSSTEILPSASFKISSGSEGCYKITASMEPWNNKTRIISYSYVALIHSSYSLPGPQMNRVIFSNDGIKILVYFDIATNQYPSSSTSFVCTLLFSFTGSQFASCIWISDTIIEISYTASTYYYDKVNVNDTVILLPNVLKRKCGSSSICSRYSYSTRQYLSLVIPEDIVVPVPSLSIPSVVSSCQDVVIDSTSSYGSGHRPWKSVLWSVSSGLYHTHNESLSRYLNTRYNVNATTAPVVIPYYYLTNTSYDITLELQNFLGLYAYETVTFRVSNIPLVPTVSLSGPSSLFTYRNRQLTFFANVDFPTCVKHFVETKLRNTSLEYYWSVYEDFRYITRFTGSLSKKSQVCLIVCSIYLIGICIYICVCRY